ncbi:DinB family protein [Paenibacillus sp. BK033]|uniref:DinB family protein n=1 Tax=Paenibacillus sp. BK033 TaxID=2512133 RepID=UPI0010488D04|nr:DinB family protein [Paenibacillus sp. BK033]TCN00947.1 DinB family protein [Paenibacillus sp. BK033]
MSIQSTMERIKRELNRILDDYEDWFHAPVALQSFLPHEGWSIAQILEHVTLTNHFLLILIRKGKTKALMLAAKSNLEDALNDYHHNLGELDQIAEHKSFKWIRPEHMEPKGEMPLERVHALLRSQIEECLGILQDLSNGEGILYKTMMSVNNLGKIDVYQYIYFLVLHAKRHIAQMIRVKAEYEQP